MKIKYTYVIFIFLIVTSFVAFGRIAGNDFINFDDNIYVTENSHVQSGISLEGIRWAFGTKLFGLWNPLVWLSFMLDYQFYGLNAGGYHVTNLILHILSTLLLFWLFCRMTGAVWKSAFVAALFALHPLHVESVAWVSERKDVLSAFFWMLTLCLYVYYTEKPAIKRFLLVLFSFILALLSKPMVVTLPVIMILLDYWPLGRFDSKKENLFLWQLKEKLPFFVLSAVIVIATLYTPNEQEIFTKSFSLSSRLANAPVACMTYLTKTFWPHDMAVYYPFPPFIPLWQVLGSSLLIIVISFGVIFMVRRMPYIFVGWMWFAITLLPVIGIIRIGSHAMADRYHYLPSIGIGIMLAWGIPYYIKSEFIRKNILFPSAITLLAVLAVLAWRQCGYWKNSIALFKHTLQVTKDNRTAHYNLGLALYAEGKIEEAIDNYSKVISISPNYSEAYDNRGNAYVKLGQYQQAIEDFNKAIHIRPDNAEAYNNRANAYNYLGQHQRAIEDYNQAISIRPHYTNAYKNRGVAFFALGNNELGCVDAKRACELGNCKLSEFTKRNGLCL